MDEKWKLSKNKSSRNSASRRESSTAASTSTSTSTSGDGSAAYLKRSSSMPAARAATAAAAAAGSPSFTSRCTNVISLLNGHFILAVFQLFSTVVIFIALLGSSAALAPPWGRCCYDALAIFCLSLEVSFGVACVGWGGILFNYWFQIILLAFGFKIQHWEAFIWL
ncbi:hypothetical protein KFK09_010408 [Dendrobium nobile]|uniref:Uncharacterized protein n=1 Tax=Dendrobium nobile TaxID=94219 RepID=A0A8T3BCI9_DENNO|nr:hypothetical protein KFK09_010408 [Dendrobium nobile]